MKARDFWRFIAISSALTIADFLWAYWTGDRPNHTGTTIIAAMSVVLMAVRESQTPTTFQQENEGD